MPEFKKDTKGFRMKGWSPFTKMGPPEPIEAKIKGGEGKSRRKADEMIPPLDMHPDAPFMKKSPMKFVSFSYSSKTSSEPAEKKSTGIKDQVYGTVDSKSAFNKNGKKDPPKKKYPKHYTKKDIKFLKDQNEDIVRDDDKVGMTKKQERKHRRKVLKYNKQTAKPLNDTQKARIKAQLKNMDPKDPEAKLLRKMLNLKKNR
tara:strand:+ start:5156 stop:5758 length:603 start_codon:yes stop_codon:yes gene_type:complete